MDALLSPTLSLPSQALLRTAYGALLLATLIMLLPHARRVFLTERYGGYAQASRLTDPIGNPIVLPLVLALWFAAAVLLIIGRHTVLAAFINLVFCWYFFIFTRWRGLLRGMGAPGFLAYWLGACVFFLEYGLYLEPTGTLRSLALLLFQFELAIILLSAGFYKLLSGYSANIGMQLGMVNPMWGHWWTIYKDMPPSHWIFRLLNHLAYVSELLFPTLVILPATRWVGGLILLVTFFFITTQIRLWLLAEMVMVSSIIYYPPGSPPDALITSAFPYTSTFTTNLTAPLSLNLGLAFGLILYLALLPAAFCGLWFNALLKRSLPPPFQALLDSFSHVFGLSLWRVFTADLTSFFVNIWIRQPGTTHEMLWARWGAWQWSQWLRYQLVSEAICVTSLFTTLKYYPSNKNIFRDRLLRYARTIPLPSHSHLRFEYVSVRPLASRFEFIPAAEYIVDATLGTVEERILDPTAPVYQPHAASRVFEADRPGSYAPRREPTGSARVG